MDEEFFEEHYESKKLQYDAFHKVEVGRALHYNHRIVDAIFNIIMYCHSYHGNVITATSIVEKI